MSEKTMMNTAQWSVSLDAQCEKCWHEFDVLAMDDVGDILRGISPYESGGIINLQCFECEYEFEAKPHTESEELMTDAFTKTGYYMLCNGKIVKLSKHDILPYLTGKEGNWLMEDGKKLGVNRDWDLAEYMGKKNPLKGILKNKSVFYLLEKAFDAGELHFRNPKQPDFEQWLEQQENVA